MQNRMFLSDNDWTAEEWERAVEEADFMEYGIDSKPDWIRVRTPEEIEIRLMQMQIIDLLKTDITEVTL